MKSKKLKTKAKRRDDHTKAKRSRSPADDGRSKRPRTPSRTDTPKEVKLKNKATVKDSKPPKKSRWQEADAKDVAIVVPGPAPRIRDHLHDKKKIVDLLFQIVPGEALQKLIPDYLEKKPAEELKQLCLAQLNLMTDEVILQIISGKSVGGEVAVAAKKSENVKVEELKKEVPAVQEVKTVQKVANLEGGNLGLVEVEKGNETSIAVEKKTIEIVNPDSTSSDILELHTTPTEIASILEDENQIPVVIKDEVAKALITPERDAELLELEMRARAIRSLLKARSQATEVGGEEET